MMSEFIVVMRPGLNGLHGYNTQLTLAISDIHINSQRYVSIDYDYTQYKTFRKASEARNWVLGGYDLSSIEGVTLLSSVFILDMTADRFISLNEQFGMKLTLEQKMKLVNNVPPRLSWYDELMGESSEKNFGNFKTWAKENSCEDTAVKHIPIEQVVKITENQKKAIKVLDRLKQTLNDTE